MSVYGSQGQAHISPLAEARSRKKRKHLQKTLDADKSLGTSEDTVPYPTGEVPGQGDCQLIDFLDGNKAKYNSFLVRPSPCFPMVDTLI